MPCKDFCEWSTPKAPYEKKLRLPMPRMERSMSTIVHEETVNDAGLVDDDKNRPKTKPPSVQSLDEESSRLNLDRSLASPPTYVDSINENGSSTTPCDIASTTHDFSDRTMAASNCGELGAPQSFKIPESHRFLNALSVTIEMADVSITVYGKCKIVIEQNEAPLFSSTNISIYDNEHRANDQKGD
ncbi:hypothetical protein ACEPAF_5357 [Sanghuangporus sanghuang]